MAPLRIGYVPEHFSTPLYFAKKYFGLEAELLPFPSGTGHMITSLRSGEIDIGIGLTEGWVAGLGQDNLEGDGSYKIVGTYVETPLCMSHVPLLLITSGTGGFELMVYDRLGNLHRLQTLDQFHSRS
jgi:hypothetical protein